MRLTRRDFLKIASAAGITSVFSLDLINKALAGNGDPRVIWLQGQSCTVCSVSLLNSVNITTIDEVLLNRINLEYHSNLIASAGDFALSNTAVHPSVNELSVFADQWLQAAADLLDVLCDCRQVIVVDAVDGNAAPGTVVQFDLKNLQKAPRSPLSLHDLDLPRTLEMARLLSCLPKEVIFWGIQPDKVECSMELTPALKSLIPCVAKKTLSLANESQLPATSARHAAV